MNMANRWAEAEFEAIFRGHYERIVRMTRSVLTITIKRRNMNFCRCLATVLPFDLANFSPALHKSKSSGLRSECKQLRHDPRLRGCCSGLMISKTADVQISTFSHDRSHSVLRSDVEAEEVCAEVFLRLYRSGPAVLDGGMVGGWLYCAATRAAIDILRRNKRRGAEEKIDSVHSAVTEDGSDDPLNRLLRGERIAEVRSILGTGN